MPSVPPYHRGACFYEERIALESALGSLSSGVKIADPMDYGLPGPHGDLRPTEVPITSSSSSVSAPRVTTYDLAPVLKPYGRSPAAVSAVTPSMSATRPPLPVLRLQLPTPFETVAISPKSIYPHVTVHDVWSVLRRFLHKPATSQELNALPEPERTHVKGEYFRRVSSMSPPDGLRRQDFLRGAVIIGVQPLNDDTITLVLDKAA